MGDNTTHGYPYPVGTDRVMDGDDAIQALAEAVDTKLGVSAAGTFTIASNGSAQWTTAVTFPTGRFSEAPAVSVSYLNGGNIFLAAVASVTATGFTAGAFRRDGNTQAAGTQSALAYLANNTH